MNKRIFVTGGASGLGLAIAQRYAEAGWKVCIGDINDQRGEKARASLAVQAEDAAYLPCDVRSEESLARVAETLTECWGGVDVVVNNAGVAQAGAIEDVSLDDWQWILDINLLGVVRGCKTFTPLFKRQGHGYFVNVASMAGLLDAPLMSSYNASKAAVVSLSETLQHELADAGIGVSVICPSFFRTNLGDSLRSTVPKMDATLDKLMSRSKITANDVAQAVFAAVEQRRFYVLPHKEARLAWRLKRFLSRELYRKFMQKQMRSMKGKRATAETAR
ncbi:short chain dehydrogenase [Alkalilimnicola ehrlichii]|uniref:SDR family oxidoreductase n=1 Tax=Alkalilimnicola ehrlichii TaxID=351052 RepID=UPI000E2EA5CB|nr:SDR family oxidoreductase [Alkalilimnicola ehrlichii]RFA24699.1 short chain dehydrogenase [Alkalilimnicola ehrlichii]